MLASVFCISVSLIPQATQYQKPKLSQKHCKSIRKLQTSAATRRATQLTWPCVI